MISSTRLFQCLRCHRQVLICQRCDRGQRYCADQCRQYARKASRQRANKKYQSSHKGRMNNAMQQKRFRQKKNRHTKIVTDQGSPPGLANDLLLAAVRPGKKNRDFPPCQSVTGCHFCGCPGGVFCRVGFLKRRTVYPSSKAVT